MTPHEERQGPRYADDERALKALLEQRATPTPPPAVREAVLAHARQPRATPGHVWRWGGALAAAAVLLLSATLYVQTATDPAPQARGPEPRPAAAPREEVPADPLLEETGQRLAALDSSLNPGFGEAPRARRDAGASLLSRAQTLRARLTDAS